jgi:hypothetical protein
MYVSNVGYVVMQKNEHPILTAGIQEQISRDNVEFSPEFSPGNSNHTIAQQNKTKFVNYFI